MKRAAVIDQAKDVLLGCLKEVPFVTVQLMKESKSAHDSEAKMVEKKVKSSVTH
jgi:hypothetical protein